MNRNFQINIVGGGSLNFIPRDILNQRFEVTGQIFRGGWITEDQKADDKVVFLFINKELQPYKIECFCPIYWMQNN